MINILFKFKKTNTNYIMRLSSFILKELYNNSSQSIASLGLAIGKSIPLVTKGIQELITLELIHDNGLAPSNGGRRASLFTLNKNKLPHILLLSIDQHKIILAVYDFANTEVSASQEIHLSIHNHESTIDLLITALEQYIKNLDFDKIAAISITMPGFVNTELGINTSYAITDKRAQLKNIIAKKYNKPTFIENDSTAIAIAEHKFGIAKNTGDLLVINLNWGVGLGMIINNKLFKGSSGYAGEFSHIPLSNLNKLCSCGKRGCLEVEASLEAAIAHALTKLAKGDSSILSNKINKKNSLAINDIAIAAKNGDQLAIESFGEIAYSLGKGIATLIHIINPEKIIISGYAINIGQILMPQIQSALLKYSIQRLSEKTQVQISSLENVQLIGTMATAITHLDLNKYLQNTNSNKL